MVVSDTCCVVFVCEWWCLTRVVLFVGGGGVEVTVYNNISVILWRFDEKMAL